MRIKLSVEYGDGFMFKCGIQGEATKNTAYVFYALISPYSPTVSKQPTWEKLYIFPSEATPDTWHPFPSYFEPIALTIDEYRLSEEESIKLTSCFAPNKSQDRRRYFPDFEHPIPETQAGQQATTCLRELLKKILEGAGYTVTIEAKKEVISVMSVGHYQGLREVVAQGAFEHINGTPWPTAPIDRGGAKGYAQLMPLALDTVQPHMIPPEQLKVWEELMWKQREELSDTDVDTLDMMSALWLSQARTVNDDAVASVDDFVDMRGLKRKKGSHGRRSATQKNSRMAQLYSLSRIQNLWLNMFELDVYETEDKKKKPRKTKQAVQSRPFVITDRFGQLRIDGFMDVEKFIFRPGKVFALYLFGPGHQVARLSAKALQYDPYRQKREKRLARYFSWHWRTRATDKTFILEYRVETLLDAVGETIDQRKPHRTRDRLEKALDTLKDDEVISEWQYREWHETERRGWWKEWIQAVVIVEAPDVIKAHYEKIAGHESLPPPPEAPPLTLGAELKAKRKRLSFSQMRLGEILGVSAAYISNVERGKVQPPKPFTAKAREWLSEDE